MIKGIVRRIDNVGRFVIPRGIMKSLKIEDGELVDVYLNGTTICIEKAAPSCVCCGKSELETELKNYKSVLMCADCHPGAINKEER